MRHNGFIYVSVKLKQEHKRVSETANTGRGGGETAETRDPSGSVIFVTDVNRNGNSGVSRREG